MEVINGLVNHAGIPAKMEESASIDRSLAIEIEDAAPPRARSPSSARRVRLTHLREILPSQTARGMERVKKE